MKETTHVKDPIGKFMLKPFTGLRNIPIMIAEVEPTCCPKCKHRWPNPKWNGHGCYVAHGVVVEEVGCEPGILTVGCSTCGFVMQINSLDETEKKE